MYAVATFLVVAVITFGFTQVATGALIATGMPREIAAFQARSAFSGAGFTTTEAENVVNHPTRRRIIATTMFVGNLGTPTLVVTVLIGFLVPGPGSTTERTLVTLAGLLLVLILIANRPIQRRLERLGHEVANSRLLPSLESDYEELLSLGDDFVVGAVRLASDPESTYRSLRGLDAALPGVQLLGVHQGERYVGMSPADIELGAGDALIVHGPREEVAAIAAPAAGR
jgi:hypothetical protein